MSRWVLFFRRFLDSRWARGFVAAFLVFQTIGFFAFHFTEAAWFASLGFSALWQKRFLTQLALFGATLLFTGAISCFLWRLALGFPVSFGANRRLARLETLRRFGPRWAALLLALQCVLTARFVAQGWREWLLFQNGGQWGFEEAHFHLDAGFWVFQLPFLQRLERAIGPFLWVLVLAIGIAGVLRALPLVLTRHPQWPVRLTRVLWILAGAIFLVRGAHYGVQTFELAWGDGLDWADWNFKRPILVAGAIFCAIWAAIVASGWAARRFKFLAMGSLLAFVAPGFLQSVVGVLLLAWQPPTGDFEKSRAKATRAAWQLDEIREIALRPANRTPAVPTEAALPLWDEKTLLEAANAQNWRFEGRVVQWQNARLTLQNGRPVALLMATAPSAAWRPTPAVSSEDSVAIAAFDIAQTDEKAEPKPQNNGLEPLFYGASGPHLVANGNDFGGVPLDSFGKRALWAWRLGDLRLLFPGVSQPRLLFRRSPRERAAALAPFFEIGGENSPVLEAAGTYWMLDLLTATPHFPNAARPAGELSEFNAARDSVKMWMDARSGKPVFFAASDAAENEPLLRVWRKSFPELVQDAAPMPRVLRRNRVYSQKLFASQSDLWAREKGAKWKELRALPLPATQDEAAREVWQSEVSGAKNWILEAGNGANYGEISVWASPFLPTKKPESGLTVAGQWRVLAAPGGAWRWNAVFEPARNEANNLVPRLVRVEVQSASPDSRVGVGPTTSEAFLDLAKSTKAPRETEKPSLEAAIQAHDAAQNAAKIGNWKQFGEASKRERRILEELKAVTSAE